MVSLPEPVDPTLEAAGAAFRDRMADEPDRPYLGMSGIGHACLRKHWYDFHWSIFFSILFNLSSM